MKASYLLLLILFFLVYPLFSQETPPLTDTTSVNFPDSLLPAPKAQKKQSGLKDKIPYKADKIRFSVERNTIYLSGNAEIKYEGLILTAEKIKIDYNENKLYAEGVPDSTDEKGNIFYKGAPVFTEKGREPMSGDFIEYDFQTKRGKITVGRTKMEPGFYKGSNIYKIADSTLLVKDGYFTTCDLPNDPHFYFIHCNS